VTTFGKVHDSTLDAGISFKAPWDDVIRMDNREQRVKFELEAFSKDIQEVQIVGSVNLNIDKATAMNLYREVGTDYLNILVAPRVQEDVKAVTSKFTAEELISNRNSLSDSMCEMLRDDLKVNGINVIAISIENIDFTDAFTNAVEAKQVATQEKQRARTQQEQQTMEAQQEAERKKIAAEAAAEVKRIQADADAYEIQVKANAEAEANEKIALTITDELIQYTQAQSWDGELPTTFVGSNDVIPVIQPEKPVAEVEDK
jgi:regulator of protease activity HflC (stomatin/prohibitin superfamily)